MLDALRFPLKCVQSPQRCVCPLIFVLLPWNMGLSLVSAPMKSAVTAPSPLSTLRDVVKGMDICSERSFSHSFKYCQHPSFTVTLRICAQDNVCKSLYNNLELSPQDLDQKMALPTSSLLPKQFLPPLSFLWLQPNILAIGAHISESLDEHSEVRLSTKIINQRNVKTQIQTTLEINE